MTERKRLSRITNLYASVQFAKFVFIGGVALALHWAARIVFDMWVSFSAAVILAYGVGMASAFILNRRFVFPKSRQDRQHEILYFVIVNLTAFPFVWLISSALGQRLLPLYVDAELARALGHAIAITTPVFFNFAAHKFLTFRES